jgi:general secretion pathway protein D
MYTGVTWFQKAMTTYQKQVNGTRKALFNFAGGGGGAAGVSDSVPSPADARTAGFSGGGLTYYFTYFDIPLDIVLRAISKDSRTRLLQSPVIHTMDNKEAKIDISTERYFLKGVSFQTLPNGTVQQVPNVELKRVGLNLTVTPHINQRKFVLMDIAQKIENKADDQPIPNQGSWPTIASREMSASIGVRSGETIVLGGLSSREEGRGHTKIPFLGDIPLLGRLFNSTDDSKTRSEILVFITPYVIDNSEEMEQETRRLKDAIGAEARWTKGWSNSQLADPAREELKEGRLPRLKRGRPEVAPLPDNVESVEGLKTNPAATLPPAEEPAQGAKAEVAKP